MKRAIKFLRTALDPASAPSEVHKASIQFMREIKACNITISEVEGALWAAFDKAEGHSDQTQLEALKTSLAAQDLRKAAMAMTIKNGKHKGIHVMHIKNEDLYEIMESGPLLSDREKAKQELSARGLT